MRPTRARAIKSFLLGVDRPIEFGKAAAVASNGASATREATVPNREGLHARPVMRFVDVASRFRSTVLVTNVTRRGEPVDGKSAMQMMLLEATQGSVLRIEARGEDAAEAVEALTSLVESGFPTAVNPAADPPPSDR